jgi:hypothetical protein
VEATVHWYETQRVDDVDDDDGDMLPFQWGTDDWGDGGQCRGVGPGAGSTSAARWQSGQSRCVVGMK